MSQILESMHSNAVRVTPVAVTGPTTLVARSSSALRTWTIGDYAETMSEPSISGLTSATKRVVRIDDRYYYGKVSSATVRIFSNSLAWDDEVEVFNTTQAAETSRGIFIDAIRTEGGDFLVINADTGFHRVKTDGTGASTYREPTWDTHGCVCFGADEDELYGNIVLSGFNRIARFSFDESSWSMVTHIAWGASDSAWNQPNNICFAPTGDSGDPRIYAIHGQSVRYYPANLGSETKLTLSQLLGDGGLLADETGSRLLFAGNIDSSTKSLRAIGYDGTGEAEIEETGNFGSIGLAWAL